MLNHDTSLSLTDHDNMHVHIQLPLGGALRPAETALQAFCLGLAPDTNRQHCPF